MNDDKISVLSLFSGCGGLDLGIEGGFDVFPRSYPWSEAKGKGKVGLPPTRFETVFANDILPFAKAAWERHFGKRRNVDGVYRLTSIVDLVKDAKNGKDVFPGDIDVVTGGFPCQDFSIAGKRKGFDSHKSHNGKRLDPSEPTTENRGHLYMWMRDVISLVRPKLFIAENVKGLVNLADVKKIIQSDFRSVCDNGYIVVDALLQAAEYGVPQSRERVVFLGFLKSALSPGALEALSRDRIPSEYNPYPEPTHRHTNGQRALNDSSLEPAVTVGEVLGDLPEPDESDDPSHAKYSRAKYMGQKCQGQTEVGLEKVGPTIRAEHHGNIEYRRLGVEHGGMIHEELERGLPERRLSVRECARIQTFPDDYEFVFGGKRAKGVNMSDAYKLIGNAVPPLLAYRLAKNLQDKWDLYFKE